MANSFCIIHLVQLQSEIPNAQEVLASFGRHERAQILLAPTHDTWSVLAEIDAIASGSSRVPRVPYPHDIGTEFAFSILTMNASKRERIWWAHRMSPHFIAKATNADIRAIDLHLQYLLDKGFIVESADLRLPDDFIIVVGRDNVPRRARRRWTLTNTMHRIWDMLHYHPGYTVVRLPKNLPHTGDEVFSPILDGPGIVAAEHQGRFWQITENGSVRLREWMHDMNAQRRRDAASRFAKRLGVATIFVSSAAIVSMIADAPTAFTVVLEFFRRLF